MSVATKNFDKISSAKKERRVTELETFVAKKHENCRVCPLRNEPIVYSEVPFTKGKSVWIIGDTPDFQEVQKRLIFSGVGGTILRRLLKEMDFYKEVERVLFTNACLCYAGDKGAPAEAVKLCRWHYEQLQKDYPPIVSIALGKTPAYSLGFGSASVEQMRGKLFNCPYGDGNAIVTYNPGRLFYSGMKYNQLLILDLKKAIQIVKEMKNQKDIQILDPTNCDVIVLDSVDDILEKLNSLPDINAPVCIDVETSIPVKQISQQKTEWIVDGLLGTDIFVFSFAYGESAFVFPFEGESFIKQFCADEEEKYLAVFGKSFASISETEYREVISSLSKKVKKIDFPKLSPMELRKIYHTLDFYKKITPGIDDIKECLKNLAVASKDMHLIGHNIVFEKKKLFRFGDFHFKADTMILAYLLNETLTGYYSLQDLVNQFIPEMENYKKYALRDDVFLYSGYDVIATLLLYEKLKQLIPPSQQEYIVKAKKFIMNYLVPLVCNLELTGIKVDRKILNQYLTDIDAIKQKSLDRIEKLTGLKSTKSRKFKEILESLYEYDFPKTQTGEVALDEESLKEVYQKTGNTTLKEIILYKKTIDMLDQYGNRYIKKILDHIDPVSERIYPNYKITGSVTGRIVTSNPPFQNIPKHGIKLCPKCNLVILEDQCELCKTTNFTEQFNISNSIIPEKGNVLLKADYSQMEVAVIAELSGDQNLINAINNGFDVHSFIASKNFKVPYEEIVNNKNQSPYQEQRQMAKSVTFGLIYGQTTKGLAKKLNISVKKAEEILNDFYANFPSVKKFINKVLSFLYKNFYVVSPVGRIRRFPKITPQAYREAQNFPVQSYASDIANYAAYYIMNMTKKYQAKLVGLVYDCIIVECPEQYKEEVKAIMQYCMKERIKKFFNLCVSLNVEIEEKFST